MLLPWVSSPDRWGSNEVAGLGGRKNGQESGVGAILTLQTWRIREGVNIKRALNGEEP